LGGSFGLERTRVTRISKRDAQQRHIGDQAEIIGIGQQRCLLLDVAVDRPQRFLLKPVEELAPPWKNLPATPETPAIAVGLLAVTLGRQVILVGLPRRAPGTWSPWQLPTEPPMFRIRL